MSGSHRNPLAQGAAEVNPRATGFDILSGRATQGPWTEGRTLQGDTLYGRTAHDAGTLTDPHAGARGALPGRLREVDLQLASERQWAVDDLELAAYLEADGLSDEALRGRYGAGGLFQSAQLLYAQRGSGRALNHIPRLAAPAFPWHMLLRGPLYLLPGVSGLLITAALGVGSVAAFMFAAAFGWGWSMTIAGLRYAEPLGVPGRALRAALLVAGVAGVLGGGLTAWLASGPDQLGWGVLVGGVMALATAAAGILLALGRTGLFAGAFGAPMLAAALIQGVRLPGSAVLDGTSLSTADPAFLLPLTLLGLGLLVAAPVAAAWSATRSPGTLGVSWATFASPLRLATYGWALAAAFVALSGQLGAWLLLPIIVTAGLLEAGVWHAQERLQQAARQVRELGRLWQQGWLILPAVTLGYAALLALSMLVAQAAGRSELRVPPAGGLIVVPLVGAALLLSAWLANQRQVQALCALWSLAAVLMFTASVPLPVLAVSLFSLLLLGALVSLHDPRSYR